MPHALDVQGLTVHYGSRRAVAELSFTIAAGEIVAMLGPNGAGKSTALAAIAGAMRPTSGGIAISGHDLAQAPLEARRRIGFADQPPSLYEFFSVREHLAFIADAKQLEDSRTEEILEQLGLCGIGDRLCRELSFGMRQRVSLAAALIGKPDVILLDETLNGLDPHAARRARAVVRAEAERGAAVLMSTHLLEVEQRLCHRIMIVDSGRVRVDMAGAELDELATKGPDAVEELYLATVVDHDVEDNPL